MGARMTDGTEDQFARRPEAPPAHHEHVRLRRPFDKYIGGGSFDCGKLHGQPSEIQPLGSLAQYIVGSLFEALSNWGHEIDIRWEEG